MINVLRQKLSRGGLQRLQRWVGWPARVVEALVFGTAVRERLLVKLLAAYFRSLKRRLYLYSPEAPHFTQPTTISAACHAPPAYTPLLHTR